MFKSALPVWAKEIKENQYVDFRQNFIVETVTPLTVNIRCHSNYALYINGELIGSGQYQDYENYAVADRLNVPTSCLRVGTNRLAVLAYAQNADSSTCRCATPSLIFEIKNGTEIICCSGEDTLCREDRCYTGGTIEWITCQLGFTFHYDARRAEDWFIADNTEGFSFATVLPRLSRYFGRPIKKLEDIGRCPSTVTAAGTFRCESREMLASQRIYTAYLRSILLTDASIGEKAVVLKAADGDGLYCIVDLGQERSGYLEMDLSVDEDCLVDVGYGEHLTDLRVRTAVGGRNFAASYFAKKGENVFSHPFTRFAGRYLQLHFYTQETVTVRYVGLREKRYPLLLRPMPVGLTQTEQRIYEVGVDTLRLCMHEHYEDCPWREQALYAMDGRNQMLCGYAAFGETRFAKASIQLLGLGLREDGLLELCAPARVPTVIPSFSLMWIVSLQEYVCESGDVSFGRRWMKVARQILTTFLDRRDNQGLVPPFTKEEYWNFYEWSEGLDGVKRYSQPDVLLNLFLAYGLQAYVALSDAIGNQKEATWAAHQYVALKTAVNFRFWDKDAGGYRFCTENASYPELAQALAVISGVAGTHSNRLVRGLAREAYMPRATLSSRIFTYQAMLTDPSTVPDIRRQIESTWGKMLTAGATSFWETEKGEADFERAGSLCHGWSAVPVYVYRCIEDKIGG